MYHFLRHGPKRQKLIEPQNIKIILIFSSSLIRMDVIPNPWEYP